MITGRWRVEVVRFGLLLTLTVALVSVAVRINHDGAGHDSAALRHRQTPPASSPARPAEPPGTTSSPSGDGSAGAGAGTPSAGSGSSPAGGGAATGAGSGAGGPAAGNAEQPVATLPRTGTGQAVRLGATALLLIAAGSWSVTAGRRPHGA